jgi:hypothetical protein
MAVDQVRTSASEARRVSSSCSMMMCKRADFGVVIGNAGEELKRQTSAINGSCDDDTFAETVER